MRTGLWLIFLTSTLIFSAGLGAATATGPELDVTYPFTKAVNETLVLNPYLEKSFLAFLKNNSVFAVINKDGLPLIYYSDNETFGCTGICRNITMNNYILGSKFLDISNISAMQTINESVIVGSTGIEQSLDIMNAVRSSLADNPDAIAEFENYLLQEQAGYLKSTYYNERYDDVWDYALEDIKNDPVLYHSILNNLKMQNIEGAVEELEKYLEDNFDINDAYDLSNLYSALENKKLGNAHIEEFMRNVLDRLAAEENIDLNLDDVDLSEFSDLLKSDEFKEMMDKASEMIKNNPELFDKLQDMAKEMLDRPETREVFKQALRELMEKGDWESIKELMDVFSKLENKEELMQTLMEGFSEHMRDMVESGQMDEMMQMLDDPAMREMLTEAFQSFSQTILESIWDRIKEIPAELSYVVALVAVIATLIILIKLKI